MPSLLSANKTSRPETWCRKGRSRHRETKRRAEFVEVSPVKFPLLFWCAIARILEKPVTPISSGRSPAVQANFSYQGDSGHKRTFISSSISGFVYLIPWVKQNKHLAPLRIFWNLRINLNFKKFIRLRAKFCEAYLLTLNSLSLLLS